MARFKMTVEYAGTRYSGWQFQKNARTVAGEISGAVHRVSGREDFELYGSGRTDAGVHALAQVAHLDLNTPMKPDDLVWKLNEELPADVNIVSVVPVPRAFHARHDARSRSYVYQVSRRRTAFAKPFVWWVRDKLDDAKMALTARVFVGRHDFRTFTEQDPREGSTVVELERCDILEQGDLILVRVVGSHFLWKMVRRMVGVIVEAGRGGLPPAEIERFLRSPSDLPAQLTAPPSGLFLERVLYDGDTADWSRPPSPSPPGYSVGLKLSGRDLAMPLGVSAARPAPAAPAAAAPPPRTGAARRSGPPRR